jgi:hypothetical protein
MVYMCLYTTDEISFGEKAVLLDAGTRFASAINCLIMPYRGQSFCREEELLTASPGFEAVDLLSPVGQGAVRVWLVPPVRQGLELLEQTYVRLGHMHVQHGNGAHCRLNVSQPYPGADTRVWDGFTWH